MCKNHNLPSSNPWGISDFADPSTLGRGVMRETPRNVNQSFTRLRVRGTEASRVRAKTSVV